MTAPTAQELARRFHEAYERLAPAYGYETRKESAVAWENVPEKNRLLMAAVCHEVMLPALVEAEARGRSSSDLAELVAAAEGIIARGVVSANRSIRLDSKEIERLLAALKPFREEKPK